MVEWSGFCWRRSYIIRGITGDLSASGGGQAFGKVKVENAYPRPSQVLSNLSQGQVLLTRLGRPADMFPLPSRLLETCNPIGLRGISRLHHWSVGAKYSRLNVDLGQFGAMSLHPLSPTELYSSDRSFVLNRSDIGNEVCLSCRTTLEDVWQRMIRVIGSFVSIYDRHMPRPAGLRTNK